MIYKYNVKCLSFIFFNILSHIPSLPRTLLLYPDLSPSKLADPGSRQQSTAVVPGLSGRAVDWVLSVNLTSALSQHPVQGGHCSGHWRDGGREEVEAGAGRRGAAGGELPGEPGQEGGHGGGKGEVSR